MEDLTREGRLACLSENSVIEFLQGVPDAVERVETHIDTCPDCRALVSSVAKSSLMAEEAPTVVRPRGDTSEYEPQEGDSFLPGTVLAGRFCILEPLGKGAMGSVYKAEDLMLKIEVAIKVLHPQIAEVPAFLRQLHHEILTGRRISHPNVRRIFDLGEADCRYFISMEYIEGETLSKRLSRGKPSVEESLAILEQICAGLHAAHSEEVVHRDLKLSNIMIDKDGRVKVMDFGLARDLSRDATTSGAAVGTPSYWSPEQSRGEPATPRSDLYGLGVIMCDLFCGESRGLESGTLLSSVSIPFRWIVKKCLARDPDDRYASAAEVRRALVRARRAKKSGRPIGWIAFATVAAGLMVAATCFWAADEASTEPVVEPQRVGPIAAADPPVERTDVVPVEETLSRRKRFRRPKPKKARPPAVVAEPSPPEPPIVSDEELEALQTRLDAIQEQRAARGILPADLEGYSTLLGKARTALRVGDVPIAEKSLSAMQTVVNQTAIDEQFINRKLERLSKLSRTKTLREPYAKELTTVLSKVHAAYFAGKYSRANDHLNQMWRLLSLVE